MEGGGGGEVRRVHVVYFLSRNGEMEQPHLIRVQYHPHRNGVRLRDVKGWLSELRGKGMPGSFAWSYKRRYKMGYVWQDLTDDDLITPISDNEYVLKGSLNTPTAAAVAAISTRSSFSSSPVLSSPSAAVSAGYLSPLADTSLLVNPPVDPKYAAPSKTPQVENADYLHEVSPKPPPQGNNGEQRRCHSLPSIHHSDASTQTSSCRAAAVEHIGPLQAGPETGPPPESSDCSACEIVEEDLAESGGEEEEDPPRNVSYCTLVPGRERRSYTWCGVAGGRASHAFRNLLRCSAGAGEVNDPALLPINPSRRRQLGSGGAKYGRGGSCRGGGEAVVLSGKAHRSPTEGGARRKTWERGKSSSTSRAKEAAGEQRKTTVPAAEPSCSQCGRPFKPEGLHSHMKSCRALKGQRKILSSGKLAKKLDSFNEKLFKKASSGSLLSD